MNRDQQPRPRSGWKEWMGKWSVLALAALAGVAIVTTAVLGYWRSWQRPFWDWLELLIIPVVLIIGAYLLNRQAQEREEKLARQERANDRAIAEDRAREDSLQRYLDKMSELLLDKNLVESDMDTVPQIVAGARTLAVIRSLEGDQRGRKNQVIRFLVESNLVGKLGLRGADLSETNLGDANLSGANLEAANLSGANLEEANLSYANLSDADLSRANLSDADLSRANLSDANLEAATLSGAHVLGANLSGANLGRRVLEALLVVS